MFVQYCYGCFDGVNKMGIFFT